MTPTYAQIQNFLSQHHSSIEKLPQLNMVVLRNITVEPSEPYIKYLAYQMGFQAVLHFGGYDAIFQESRHHSVMAHDADIDVVLVFSKLENLSPKLIYHFGQLTPTDIKAEIERLQGYFHRVLAGIRSQSQAMILWHGFELPAYPSLGISDAQTTEGQTETIIELNRVLKAQLAMQENAYFVDMNTCLIRLGIRAYYDARYWHIAKSPYSSAAWENIISEDFKFIRALKGKNKKCLVLDCDNVLWGGIIGEDGLAGIKLGTTYPGSIYHELQHTIVDLHQRGVILALCSKNNAADVWEVFHQHPDMVLKEKHIATAQINWRDKASNLRQIALDLNIGLDSIVFVDDSEFEINLVKQELPEVETIHFNPQNAVWFSQQLMELGWFDILTITEEDRMRGQMYKAAAARKQIQAQITNMDEYYRSLELVAEVKMANEFTIPRIAQLTQKTNQFNLTTKRYSEADIKAFQDSNDSDVISLRLKDRFGDLGIVGVCILRYDTDKTAIIDTFLFSCRALGRKAEDILLQQAIQLARHRGAMRIIGIHIPTKKNEQTRTFYTQHGFSHQKISKVKEQTFVLEIEEYLAEPIQVYKQIISDIPTLREEQ